MNALMDSVLVANRGEIAVRIIRTLRRLGIRAVAVYSDADAGARHVREADTAVRIGPAPAADSYLSVEALLDAAHRTGAAAVHPGYGFLAENAAFARAVTGAGLTFVGPPADAIALMGDKIRAKETVAAAGVPVVPGASGAELAAEARKLGMPVLLKPSAGGGGKGMRLVREEAALEEEIAAARRQALAAFGDDTLLVERWIEAPGTSRSRCWPTGTAPSCTSASASAPSSAGTRRSSRRRPARCWTPPPAPRWARPPSPPPAPAATGAPARWSSSSPAPTRARTASWR